MATGKTNVGAILAAGLAALVSIGYWFVTVGLPNLSGVCPAVGRPLTYEEKKAAFVAGLNKLFREETRGNSTWVGRKIEYDDKTTLDIGRIKLLDLTAGKLLAQEFKVYPEVPDHAKYPNGDYISYYDGDAYEPVNSWYRIKGYAHDLVFFDIDLVVKSEKVGEFSHAFSVRRWINSCGEIVELPEEYEVG